MRKHLNGILLVFVLVGLPFGSYLYLKSGFNFRKSLIDDLRQTEPLKDTLTQSHQAVITRGKCTVISIRGTEQNQISLYDQFKDAKGFQLVGTLDSAVMAPYMLKRQKPMSVNLPVNYFQLDSNKISSLQKHYPQSHYLILDTLGFVRMQYKETKDDLKKIAGHITVLLPLYKE
jgi:hypothetical protein